MKRIILIILFVISACDRRDSIPTGVPVSKSLLEYVNESYFLNLKTAPLALAYRNQNLSSGDTVNAISVIFMPAAYSAEYKYFETASANIDTLDFSLFNERSPTEDTLYNGYLSKFIRSATDKDIWCRITFETYFDLYISSAVIIKSSNYSTVYEPDLVNIDLSDGTHPFFSWTNDTIPGNNIYLQLISDASDNLISGTFTHDKYFQFYDLSNVIINISPTPPDPILEPYKTYKFILMGIGKNNWVNLISERYFTTR